MKALTKFYMKDRHLSRLIVMTVIWQQRGNGKRAICSKINLCGINNGAGGSSPKAPDRRGLYPANFILEGKV